MRAKDTFSASLFSDSYVPAPYSASPARGLPYPANRSGQMKLSFAPPVKERPCTETDAGGQSALSEKDAPRYIRRQPDFRESFAARGWEPLGPGKGTPAAGGHGPPHQGLSSPCRSAGWAGKVPSNLIPERMNDRTFHGRCSTTCPVRPFFTAHIDRMLSRLLITLPKEDVSEWHGTGSTPLAYRPTSSSLPRGIPASAPHSWYRSL